MINNNQNIRSDKFIYSSTEGITIVKKPVIVNENAMHDNEMTTIKHKFRSHHISKDAEILIIGTFNPDTSMNDANFFYSRQRNYLWKILPNSFNEGDLKGASRIEKENFISKHKIDFVDLIEEIIVDNGQETNYYDAYLDKQKIQWKDIVSEIQELPNLKKVCFTRTTFSDIPNMNKKISSIQHYCVERNIFFKRLVTPARFYNNKKQEEWNKFLLNDN